MEQKKIRRDAKEFLKDLTPAAKQSRLVPYLDDITMLRDSNCSLEQVREFLESNGVTISVPGLSTFIKRRKEKDEKGGRPAIASRAKATPPKDPSATKDGISKVQEVLMQPPEKYPKRQK